MKKRICYSLLAWMFAASSFMYDAAFAQTEPSREAIAPSTEIHTGENKVTTASALTPVRDATEVLQRLLALINSLHRPQDLTPERVAQFTGLPMIRINTPADFYYKSSHDLNERWWYYYIWSLDDATHLPGLGFSFNQTQEEIRRPPMTDICQFDVAHFHEALLRRGFRHISSTRRESPARQYQRDVVLVEIGIVGESGESLEKISHDCIKRVSVDFLEKYIDLGTLQ